MFWLAAVAANQAARLRKWTRLQSRWIRLLMRLAMPPLLLAKRLTLPVMPLLLLATLPLMRPLLPVMPLLLLAMLPLMRPLLPVTLLLVPPMRLPALPNRLRSKSTQSTLLLAALPSVAIL